MSGLTSYVEYYWRVDVSDEKETTQGQEQSKIRTYCYTTYCSGGYSVSNGRTCTNCDGTGEVKGGVTTKTGAVERSPSSGLGVAMECACRDIYVRWL